MLKRLRGASIQGGLEISADIEEAATEAAGGGEISSEPIATDWYCEVARLALGHLLMLLADILAKASTIKQV
jgi:hypothetical protein